MGEAQATPWMVFLELSPEDFTDERAQDYIVRSIIQRTRHLPG